MARRYFQKKPTKVEPEKEKGIEVEGTETIRYEGPSLGVYKRLSL